MKNILTDVQKEHLRSALWLIDGNRGSGRTTVLAIAFLKKAKNNLGEWIKVFDHDAHPMSTKNMIAEIGRLFSHCFNQKRYEIEIKLCDNSFRILSK